MIDRSICRLPVPEAVAAACEHGVDWVQIRDRGLPDGALLELSREILSAAHAGSARRGARSLVIVNRRSDFALALDADGVHLGTGALAPADVRELWSRCPPVHGAAPLIGVSAHSADECAAAAAAGADYVHLAPIFPPRSKSGTRPPLGTEVLRVAVRAGLPVLAQGGVSAGHCRELIAAGAAGVAVTGEILMRDDPGKATAEIRRSLDTTDA